MNKLHVILLSLFIPLSASAQVPFSCYALLLKNGTSTIATTTNGAIYYDVGLNKFQFRQNGAWIEINPTATTVTFGTTTQIPITNSGGTDFSYSSNFTYDITNNIFKTARSFTNTNSGTQNNNVVMGESHQFTGTRPIRWATAIGEQGLFESNGTGTMNNATILGAFNSKIAIASTFSSFSCGIYNSNNSYIAALTASTTSSMILSGRNDTITNASSALASGYRAKVTGDGAYGHGFFDTYSGGSHSGTIQSCEVAGRGGFGHFTNTSAATVGKGVQGPYGVALGGWNPYIPSTSTRCGILGGNGIQARASDDDQWYLPTLNIDTSPTRNDTVSQILVRDRVTKVGQVQWRSATSISTYSPIHTITTNTTASVVTHGVILVDATGGNVTINLPTAASAFDSNNSDGKEFIVKLISAANNAIVDGSGSETIDGATTHTLTVQYSLIRFKSNGTAWYIVGQ